MVKGKAVPVLGPASRHEGVWGTEVQLRAFLTSTLDEDEWGTFTPRLLYPRRNSARYPFDRRLHGPRSLSARYLSLPGIERRLCSL
jgi:hypothetical protein